MLGGKVRQSLLVHLPFILGKCDFFYLGARVGKLVNHTARPVRIFGLMTLITRCSRDVASLNLYV